MKSKAIQNGTGFGRLTVVMRAANTDAGHAQYACQCDCGHAVMVRAVSLQTGATTSCGCYQRERVGGIRRTHGMSGGKQGHKGRAPEYQCWAAMNRRCHTVTDKRYPNYGGRGISVCERWRHSFENFLSDMGLRPSPDHTLDRKDNEGNYEPSNCRWVVMTVQANNTRRNRRLDYDGKSLTISEWTRELGYPREVIRRRIKDGWPIEDALLTPPTIYHGKRMAKRLREAGVIQ